MTRFGETGTDRARQPRLEGLRVRIIFFRPGETWLGPHSARPPNPRYLWPCDDRGWLGPRGRRGYGGRDKSSPYRVPPCNNVTHVRRMIVCQRQRINHDEKYDLASSAVDQGRISVRCIATLPAWTTAMRW